MDKITQDKTIPRELILEDLSQFATRKPDIVVEVAHPSITDRYAVSFLQYCDFFLGSPTAFADPQIETKVKAAATVHGIYVPSGALWGAEDIKKMAERGTLRGLTITMKKHPSSLRLEPSLQDRMVSILPNQETVVFEGSVRELCRLAPNNVNTMACAALAGFNLGFDGTKARLIADPRLTSHIIEIEVLGPEIENLGYFSVKVERINPAVLGAVTGTQTYDSFLSSLLQAKGRGPGLHFC